MTRSAIAGKTETPGDVRGLFKLLDCDVSGQFIAQPELLFPPAETHEQ